MLQQPQETNTLVMLTQEAVLSQRSSLELESDMAEGPLKFILSIMTRYYYFTVKKDNLKYKYSSNELKRKVHLAALCEIDSLEKWG